MRTERDRTVREEEGEREPDAEARSPARVDERARDGEMKLRFEDSGKSYKSVKHRKLRTVQRETLRLQLSHVTKPISYASHQSIKHLKMTENASSPDQKIVESRDTLQDSEKLGIIINSSDIILCIPRIRKNAHQLHRADPTILKAIGESYAKR
ncbi:hypothetical protein Sjap_013788 [Stephania japonica]|uniref:Uncharacterized protein n=1 Tax=Stephania japonica TaxID=461633 RepID=A0AAP0J141_9MAGN